MREFFYTIGILAVFWGIILCYEKWKNNGPSQGRGLTGIAQDYFLRISNLTQSLTSEKRKHILEQAYLTIKDFQKGYNPQGNVEFLHVLFNDKYKDSVRIDCFAISFVLCDRLRSYGPDELGRKMAIAYYDDLKQQLGDLYDYCIDNNKYFPGEIVDCFCSDGYYILKEYSKYFAKEKKSQNSK